MAVEIYAPMHVSVCVNLGSSTEMREISLLMTSGHSSFELEYLKDVSSTRPVEILTCNLQDQSLEIPFDSSNSFCLASSARLIVGPSISVRLFRNDKYVCQTTAKTPENMNRKEAGMTVKLRAVTAGQNFAELMTLSGTASATLWNIADGG